MSATRTETHFHGHNVIFSVNGTRTKIDVTADLITVGPYSWKDVVYQVDVTKKGIGGLAPGSALVASTWYGWDWITDGRGNSLEAWIHTHTPAAEPTLPRGFVYVGHSMDFLTDVAPQFYRFNHVKRHVNWNENTELAPFRRLAGAAPVGLLWTQLSLAPALPPDAFAYAAAIQVASGALGQCEFFVQPSGGNGAFSPGTAVVNFSARGVGQPEGNRLWDYCDSLQRIDRADLNVQAASIYFDVTGFYLAHSI